MARTLEEFTIPEGHSGQIFTRSSFGRLGLSVTCNAGYINPGYRGHMPLQIANLGSDTIQFNPLISVCQLVLYRLTTPSERPYGSTDLLSKYSNDEGGPSRWWLDAIIQRTIQGLGAVGISDDVQDELLKFLIQRDVSTGDRFLMFLPRAKQEDRETFDAILEAFARRERRSMLIDRALTAAAGVPTLLIAATIGSFFGVTPFLPQGYGWPHFLLWAVTAAATLLCLPIYWRKLNQRDVGYFLHEDLEQERLRRAPGGVP